MFRKATLSYPLYELINKYSKQFVRTRFEAAGEGRYLPGNWCSGPVAICVAVLRSVLEYNVPWLDITPFLPICLVQYASFKDNIPPEALQFPRVVRVEDRRSGLCMSYKQRQDLVNL